MISHEVEQLKKVCGVGWELSGRDSKEGSHACLRHLQDDIGRTQGSAASSVLLLPKGTS